MGNFPDSWLRHIRGIDDGRDRKADPPTYSGTTQIPGPSDDGALLTAKDIQAARDALDAAAPTPVFPGGISWVDTGSTFTIHSVSPSFFKTPDDPEITVESTGIEIGEIIAWRAWRIKHGVLTSLVRDTVWMPDETVEGVIKGIGDHGKLLGIYSFKKASDAWNGCIYTADKYVSGQVALWGEVVEHEEGYRAENARVHSLDFIRPETPENETLLNKLRQRYGLAT